MTDNEIHTIIATAADLFLEGKGRLRFGQCLWYAAIGWIGPARLEHIRGASGRCDPFYSDANISGFLALLPNV